MQGRNIPMPGLRHDFFVVARDLSMGQNPNLSRINGDSLRELASSLGVTIVRDNNRPVNNVLGSKQNIACFILGRMQAAIAMDPPDLSEIRKVRKQIVACMDLGIVIEGEPEPEPYDEVIDDHLQLVNAFFKFKATGLFVSTAFYEDARNKIQDLNNFFSCIDANRDYNPLFHSGIGAINALKGVVSTEVRELSLERQDIDISLVKALAFSEQLENLLVIQDKLIAPDKKQHIKWFEGFLMVSGFCHAIDVHSFNSSLYYGAKELLSPLLPSILPEFRLDVSKNYIWKFQPQITFLLPFVGAHRLYSGYNQGKLSPQDASPKKNLAKSLMFTSGLWAGALCLTATSVGQAASAAIAPVMLVYSAYALYDIGFALGKFNSAVLANPDAPTTGKGALTEGLCSAAFLIAAFHVFHTLPKGIQPEGIFAPINEICAIFGVNSVQTGHSALLKFTVLTTCWNSYTNGRSCDHNYLGQSLTLAAISGAGIAVAACFGGAAAVSISSAYLASNIAYAAGDLVGYYRGV